jgi:hypothetical protein
MGEKAGGNPWNAPTLEWLAAQAGHSFRSIVPITSRYPI